MRSMAAGVLVFLLTLSACADARPAPQTNEALFGRTLTLEQARADTDFGALALPPPDGFSFAQAARVAEGSQDELRVRYENEEGYIGLTIRHMREEYSDRMADTDNAYSYDLSLYKAPFLETVPDEYKASVDRPIFELSELSADILDARTQQDGRRRFSVLSDGLLTDVDAKGIDNAALQTWLEQSANEK